MSLNSIDNYFITKSMNIDLAASLLGSGKLKTLWSVHRTGMGSVLSMTFLLVLMEVMKELPISLILQPFNFNTLATLTYYQFDSVESFGEASWGGLGLIVCGLVSVYFINKTQGRYDK